VDLWWWICGGLFVSLWCLVVDLWCCVFVVSCGGSVMSCGGSVVPCCRFVVSRGVLLYVLYVYLTLPSPFVLHLFCLLSHLSHLFHPISLISSLSGTVDVSTMEISTLDAAISRARSAGVMTGEGRRLLVAAIGLRAVRSALLSVSLFVVRLFTPVYACLRLFTPVYACL
jgi:hypothetical protein